jgi:DNA helicase II / ATP-dependent DNA helicase PcrA
MTDKQQQYHDNFLKIIDQLNVRQREAVEQIEGTVLVLAGPGTGKTHILSARIGRILQETDAFSHNILCLTYTESGVHAMRERLLEFIGPEAHKVHIFTFHSFCNKIIQENLELFGTRDAEPISDLEKVELIREVIDELPDDHLIKRLKGDPYLYERQLSALFDSMKSEYWTAEYIQNCIRAFMEDLPNREEFVYQRNGKDFKKGEIKTHKIAEQEEKMSRLSASVDLYAVYFKKMQQRKRYDFGDMIQWVLKAFQEKKFLLRRYQEQYLYVLVDEFQDTNGAQNQILRHLTDYWQQPNVFVVGDDDQSIYEFQGARVKNIMDFHKDYNDVKLIVLNENYRSSQAILDSASVLIKENKIRLVNRIGEVDKNLLASNAEIAHSIVVPKIVAYPNSVHEETDIANQIEILQKNKVSLNEIAVIYAKHRQANQLIKLLESKDIAYHTKRKINILDLPIIQNMLGILNYIQNEVERPYSGERQLYELLYINFLDFLPEDIARMSIYFATQQNDKNAIHIFWRNLLKDSRVLRTLKLKNSKSIAQFMNNLELLIRNYQNVPLTVLVEQMINRTGLLHFIAKNEEKLWLVQVVSTFTDFIETETVKNPRLNIRDLMNIIERMRANRIILGVQKTMFSTEGVQLITAHSSKGLEFQYVYMLGCLADFWQPTGYVGRNQFAFPDTLTLSVSASEDATEAARRLFYVAMTRAKTHLQLSYSEKSKDDKALQRTIFMDEVLADSKIKIEKKQLSNPQIYASQLLQLKENKKLHIQPLSKEELNGLLEDFVLSVSSLSKFLVCPLTFYYENVLRVPSVSSVAAAYGSAVHHILERTFQKMRSSKDKSFQSEQDFMTDFQYELNRQRSYFSDKQFRDRMAFGKKILPAYYQHSIKTWYKDEVLVEMDIRNVEISGVPIRGLIDKVEFFPLNEIRIVDYKTGKFAKEKIQPPTESKPLGGDYWRQVVFYKILLENYQNRGWRVSSGIIDYVEPFNGEYLKPSISITPEDVITVKEQIVDTYHRIMKHDFFVGCGLPTCTWCNFAKHHEIADSYRTTIDEEMDE